MLQFWLKDKIAERMPGRRITVDYAKVSPTFLVVYYEGGAAPSPYDLKWREQRYMVWIESEDWGLAQHMAFQIYEWFHEYEQGLETREEIDIDFLDANNQLLNTQTVFLHSLTAASEPNPLGVEDGRMRYSVNFDAKLTKKKGGQTP